MNVSIIFCCHKAAIYYMTQHKNQIKCLFQDNVGKKYIIKVTVMDPELIKQYEQSKDQGNLYVIDINDDNLDKVTDDKIKLNHMGIIILEETNDEIYPVFNVYTIGLLCFLSCYNCKQDGCPAKSSCCKLAIDIIRLWNTMGYNPTKYDEKNEKTIKTGLQNIYNEQVELYNNLPKFIQKEIDNF